MGGSVSVESEENKGTTFIMNLKTKCMFSPKTKVTEWLVHNTNLLDIDGDLADNSNDN